MKSNSLFPEDMIKTNSNEFSIEFVAGRLLYFHEELHMLHWPVENNATHRALGTLYEYVHDFKDGVIEKLMGYEERKIKAYKMVPAFLSETVSPRILVTDLIDFAYDLMLWADKNRYLDISNLAQSLSGEAAQTRYLLTQS